MISPRGGDNERPAWTATERLLETRDRRLRIEGSLAVLKLHADKRSVWDIAPFLAAVVQGPARYPRVPGAAPRPRGPRHSRRKDQQRVWCLRPFGETSVRTFIGSGRRESDDSFSNKNVNHINFEAIERLLDSLAENEPKSFLVNPIFRASFRTPRNCSAMGNRTQLVNWQANHSW
jgi:hypothetical protein